MIRLWSWSMLPLLAVLFLHAADAPAQQPATNAVGNLKVAEGLEATLFAAEPMLLSPSDIDVDHLGRVWVCEVVNYRGRNGQRAEGDRILILEDTDHDGRADKQTVFYQGRDIDSALGICVLGNRVLVSVAPNVFVFTDENGDGKADKKEVLFSKVGQAQHDHSTHAFIFGPDGKLYWNVGNTGHAVHDKDGKRLVDLAGNEVVDSGNPYRNGMAFRCNPDGSEFEVLGWNFRNNYELAVDSFGTVWQSDNDDDGNRSVRINYLMEFGNFGYVAEENGAGWKTARTNLESEISQQHWHQNDPGVVPNLLITGAGSPTGICLYEGQLLPKIFHNQIIHCDAGPNVCRSYPVTKDGAGYKAEVVSILDGIHDQWFRPSDVCVAPDGSLIVSDWYDPGVGGHRMGDVEKGRIFRVAPPKTAYTIPKYDTSTIDGAIAALQSPNLEARYLGWTALHARGAEAEPAMQKLYKSKNPRDRARAFWLLTKIEGRGREYVDRALADSDSDIRITGLRAARELKFDVLPLVARLAKDSSPQVRRECAIALRGNSSAEAARLWAELAAQHNGHDRWYLEALGIGAAGHWDTCFAAWLDKVGGNWNTPAGQDIVWRSRADKTSEYLAKIINDPSTSVSEIPRYFRAFDFQTGPAKQDVLVALAFETSSSDSAKQALVAAESVGRIEGFDISKNPKYASALGAILDRSRGSQAFVTLVEKFSLADRYPQLLAMAQASPDSQVGVEAMRVLLTQNQRELIRRAIDGDPKLALQTVRALGSSGNGRVVPLLLPLLSDGKQPDEIRQDAVRSLAKSRPGAAALVKLANEKQLDTRLKPIAGFALYAANYGNLKADVERLFPLPPTKNSKPLPPLADLLKAKGNAARGKLVFETTGTCAKCHVVNGQGKEVGPNLSEIGSKLSREAMFESILYPSAGISHNYETYLLLLDDGNTAQGILISQTPEEVSLKANDAIVRTFKRSQIEQMEKQNISLMPADLQKVMTADELVDVVEFVSTLKKK